MVNISLNKIRAASILLLALPVFLFFLLWLRPVISIPATVLLGLAVVLALRGKNTQKETLSFKISHLVLIGIIVLLWVYISGQGVFFTQTKDNYYRNPIFRDLINYSWPVRYEGANDESLVYYIGYWLVPAMVGKIATHLVGFQVGYLIARIALVLWCSIFIFLTMLLICFKLKQNSMKGVLTIALVFVFFSGMDIVGAVGTNSLHHHIELWTVLFSYSSMATQIIDVFNQAVPAWLAIALTINEKDEKSYALIGLLLLSSSPLPLVGLAVYMLYRAIKNLITDYKKGALLTRVRTLISPINIISVLVLLPIYWIYYDNNIAIESGVSLSATNHFVPESSPVIIPMYIAFVLLEFGLLLLAISSRKNLLDSIFIGATLAVIPFIHIGWSIDFCMRVSIPSLFLLMVMLMEYLMAEHKKDKFRYVLAVIIFFLGTFTAIIQHGFLVRSFINTHGESVKQFDVNQGLSDLTLEEKGNFVGVDSENTLYFRYLARK